MEYVRLDAQADDLPGVLEPARYLEHLPLISGELSPGARFFATGTDRCDFRSRIAYTGRIGCAHSFWPCPRALPPPSTGLPFRPGQAGSHTRVTFRRTSTRAYSWNGNGRHVPSSHHACRHAPRPRRESADQNWPLITHHVSLPPLRIQRHRTFHGVFLPYSTPVCGYGIVAR